MIFLMLFVGCVKQPCPPQDLTFFSMFQEGLRPVFLEQGFFDDREIWLDEGQWKELIEKEQRELEYQRRFGD